MAREIKTTISLDGEQKFKQSLSAATREMRVMESELKAVSAAYEANGNAAQYYASKQANLRSQISQQREIISALERAVEDAAKAYGESSSQVDGYAIRLNNARTRMARLQKELDATDREVEELGRDSVRAGRQLEQGIGDGAEAAENSVKSLLQTMQQDIRSIEVSSAVSAVTGLWDMATSAYSSVTGFVEQTAEYRQKLSFLEQNAATRGFDFEILKTDLTEVQGITRDAASAIETLSNLLAADPNEWQLEKAIDNLAGAVISFPDTLKFESLADGLQETIATGSATGQFGELLERLEIDVDEFNEALEKSETKSGDLEIALAYLAKHGMSDVYEKWKQNNQAMVEAQQTQAELEAELARFGGTLENYIVTPVKSLLVDALGWVNDTIEREEEKKAVEKSLEGKVESGEIDQETANAINNWVDKSNKARILQDFGKFTSAGANWLVSASKSIAGQEAPVNAATYYGSAVEQAEMAARVTAVKVAEQQKEAERALIVAITDLTAGWKPQKTSQETDNVTRVSAADMKTILGYKSMDVAAKAVDKLNEAGEAAADALMSFAKNWKSPTASYFPGIGGFKGPTAGIPSYDEIAIITGPNGENILPTGIERDMGQILKDLGITLKESEPELQEAGEGAGSAVSSGFDSGISGMSSAAYTTGAQAAAQMAAGLLSQVGYVAAAGSALGSAASSGMGSASAGRGTSGKGVIGTAAGVINAVLNIDGRTFAQATAPYMSSALAVATR